MVKCPQLAELLEVLITYALELRTQNYSQTTAVCAIPAWMLFATVLSNFMMISSIVLYWAIACKPSKHLTMQIPFQALLLMVGHCAILTYRGNSMKG